MSRAFALETISDLEAAERHPARRTRAQRAIAELEAVGKSIAGVRYSPGGVFTLLFGEPIPAGELAAAGAPDDLDAELEAWAARKHGDG